MLYILRYDSLHLSACASTAAANAINYPFINYPLMLSLDKTFNPPQPGDIEEEIDVNTIFLTFNLMGYCAGVPGSITNTSGNDIVSAQGGRTIANGDFIYNVFDETNRADFLANITGPEGVCFGVIAMFIVNRNGDCQRHFASITRVVRGNVGDPTFYHINDGDGMDQNVFWILCDGQLKSSILLVEHSNLENLLFSIEGRRRLGIEFNRPSTLAGNTHNPDQRVVFNNPQLMGNFEALFGDNPQDAYLNHNQEEQVG